MVVAKDCWMVVGMAVWSVVMMVALRVDQKVASMDVNSAVN